MITEEECESLFALSNRLESDIQCHFDIAGIRKIRNEAAVNDEAAGQACSLHVFQAAIETVEQLFAPCIETKDSPKVSQPADMDARWQEPQTGK